MKIKPIAYFVIGILLGAASVTHSSTPALRIAPPISIDDEPIPHDGAWWQRLPTNEKLDQVVGMFDGMVLGAIIIRHQMLAQGKPSPTCAQQVFRVYGEGLDKHFGGINAADFIIGISNFYKDFRNRKILIEGAMWLVAHSISGTPQKEIEAMTESYRRGAMRKD